MINEITLKQKCVVMRNGVEIWCDEEKADRFGADCVAGMKGVVKFEGRFINTADFVGIFYPADMNDLVRRKNKQWKCKSNNWHDMGEKCKCLSIQEEELKRKRDEAIRNCGKCQNGFITGEGNVVKYCECIKNLKIK